MRPNSTVSGLSGLADRDRRRRGAVRGTKAPYSPVLSLALLLILGLAATIGSWPAQP